MIFHLKNIKQIKQIFLQKLCLILKNLAIVFLGLIIVSCDSPEANHPVRVSSNNWAGFEPLYIAEALGYYPEDQVHLIETPASFVLMQSLQAGTIDVAAVSLSRALNFIERGQDITIVAVLDWSHGADKIMAHPDIKNISDLAGKRVAAEADTVNTFLLLRALEQVDMTTDDITLISMANGLIPDAYKNKEIEAASLFGPETGQLSEFGAHTIYDSSDIPGEIIDVLIVRSKYLQQNNQKITTVIKGWLEAVEFIKNTDDKAKLPQGLMETKDFHEARKQIKFAGISENTMFLSENATYLQDTINKRLKSYQSISNQMNFSNFPVIDTKPFESAVLSLKK